jgi:hypothetical protein
MDPPDDDIEFDFFEDERPTGESVQGSRARAARTSSRKPRRPVGPPRGTAPLLRLLGLVVFVIVIVLLFALFVASCTSTSRHSAYAAYMTKVDNIARESTANGKQLASALAQPGVNVTALVSNLDGIASAERQNVAAAEALDPPGRLRDENGYLVEALELRVSGIEGLAQTFQDSSKASNASGLLADAGDRLLASDVVWDDLFKALTTRQLTTDGVTGVQPPESHSLSSVDLVSAHQMALVLQRISGASTGGKVTGIHGTNIVSVKALPGGQILNSGSLNTVTTGTDLQIVVTVDDSGDSQEVHIPVSLTITGTPEIKKQSTIVTINPGEQTMVTFGDLGAVSFGRQVTLSVDVRKVPGEVVLTNNSAQFPVIFSLPG